MECPPDVLDELQKRLRRVEGQIRGLQRLLDEGADCRKVLTQLAAAKGALDSTGFKILLTGLRYCEDDPEGAAEEGLTIGDLERLFVKLA